MAESGNSDCCDGGAGREILTATVAQVGFNVAQIFIPLFFSRRLASPSGIQCWTLAAGSRLDFLPDRLDFTWPGDWPCETEAAQMHCSRLWNTSPDIAYTLSIMLPVYLQTHDQELAWQVGAASVVWTGVIKLFAAPFCGSHPKFIPSRPR